MILLLALTASPSLAGDGPWTLGVGQTNLYLGLDYFRYQSFRRPGAQMVQMGSGITATGATAVITRGLTRGTEVELRLPFERVRANDPESAFCTTEAPRTDWCQATAGLGDLMGIVKIRLMDEADFRPLSVAAGAMIRTGEFYSENRARLTTLGDGQTDIGAMVSIGRTQQWSSAGWIRASTSAAYWYRLPHANAPKVPADEIAGDLNVLLSPNGSFAIGPTASYFFKLGGEDLDPALLQSINGFASLRGSQLKAGGKLGLYGKNGLTLSVAAQYSVYAMNNPADTLAISVGMGWFMDDS
ncbi:MAG: hypothetical protein KTR31_13325 [Myxococcales bacterium]|nr:hypothetical protein [Myxococcales bacterium]